MEYYSAVKRGDALAPAPAWMGLEDTVLSGGSLAQEPAPAWFRLHVRPSVGKSAWGTRGVGVVTATEMFCIWITVTVDTL